jgi:septum formation protein
LQYRRDDRRFLLLPVIQSLLLASQSPRRKAILQFLEVPFQVVIPRDVSEERRSNESPLNLVRRLALEKAKAVQRIYPTRWVLGADTVVVHGRKIYGKPQKHKDALTMLMKLQGGSHRVLTGAALVGPKGKKICHVGQARVYFKKISIEHMTRYVKTVEPYDKAGGYDIRGTARFWIKRLEGDYFTVMGLPVPWLMESFGKTVFRS